MVERVFPERQRCKACSKKLGGTRDVPVLLGLYCSARCAGMATAATSPDLAPRECKTERDGRWQFKRKYRALSEIPDRIKDDPSVSTYWCRTNCGHLHIGHSRLGQSEALKMVGSPAEIAEVLVKLREQAGLTRKQVAARAKVRPIRVRELEEPDGQPVDLGALFAVLDVYRARLGVGLRTRSGD